VQNGFDAHRLVLLPTYLITPNIIFNAEIEFEHGGSAFDADDKLHGSAEIEQIWIDFKMIDQFNWRAPGIASSRSAISTNITSRPVLQRQPAGDLSRSYSVDVEAPATSVYGRLTDGLYYTLQASSSFEDFGGDFDKRNRRQCGTPFPTGYPAGIRAWTPLGSAAGGWRFPAALVTTSRSRAS